MIKGRDIVYISSIDWNFIWHSPQEIAKRFAEAGNRVLFIENMGVRAPTARDVRRVGRRLTHWAGAFASRGVREVMPNVFACSPLVLPPFGSGLAREVNRRVLIKPILRAVENLQMRNPLIWTFLPTDTTLDLMKELRGPESAAAYYCISDFNEVARDASRLSKSEQETVSICDVVFANCTKLASRFSQWNENVHVFPVGVNLEAFPLESVNGSKGTSQNGPLPTQILSQLPKPLIGYVGGLHKHVDIELLAEMARLRPDWSFVLIGPAQRHLGDLSLLTNVHLLGQRPHEELAHLIRAFDVGIVPYSNNQYTETVVPTKINEYLALGKPVVSTNLPTVNEFNDEHDILLTAETHTQSFLTAIEKALQLPNDDQTMMRRRHVAGLNDWNVRFGAMVELFEARINERKRSRL